MAVLWVPFFNLLPIKALKNIAIEDTSVIDGTVTSHIEAETMIS